MISINKKEVDKFSQMASEWWDPNGKFKPLHKFNPIRIKYIKENIINNFNLENKKKPLQKLKFLISVVVVDCFQSRCAEWEQQ